jgi:hypothetical protein
VFPTSASSKFQIPKAQVALPFGYVPFTPGSKVSMIEGDDNVVKLPLTPGVK